MKTIDRIKQQHLNGELTCEETLEKVMHLFVNMDNEIDSLIRKYDEKKMFNLNNLNKHSGNPEYEWYNSAFCHMVIFLRDLKDIKSNNKIEDVVIEK